MADVKKATTDMKKLDLGKDLKVSSGGASPTSPTSPKSLTPSTPTSTPTTPTSPGPAGVTRNPSAIKETILNWCKAVSAGYEHVNITNFSGSWADGMAFCAIIHHYYPNAFDYTKLNPKNRRGNFKLAFDVADKLAGIAPLLEVEDMVRMKDKPDWKCVFTYVQSLYRNLVTLQKQQQQPEAKKDEAEEKKEETTTGEKAEEKKPDSTDSNEVKTAE